MKARIFFAVMIIVIFWGCKTTQIVPQPQQEEPAIQLKQSDLVPWLQSNAVNLEAGDPAEFHAQCFISVKGKIPIFEKRFENGIFVTEDKSVNIDLPVAPETPGTVVAVEQGPNGPISITIQFLIEGENKKAASVTSSVKKTPNRIDAQEEDAVKDPNSSKEDKDAPQNNPKNYWRVFKVLDDGTFTLDSEVEIFHDGKSWGGSARIKGGDGSGYCKLFVRAKNYNNQKTLGGPPSKTGDIKGFKILQ